jgi:hypothetical protein
MKFGLPLPQALLGRGREAHPLDLLRRRLTSGLQVAAGNQVAHRGEEVEALITISSPGKIGNVEVGVVCTEYYDEEDTDTDMNTGYQSTSRVTSDEIAHEAWLPVETISGAQSLHFTIPPDAPFTYRGACLSFKWEVVARGRRRRGLDSQARSEFSVLP